MEKIVVADRRVGSCTIEYNSQKEDENLTEKKQLAIKALAGLQLVCITRTAETEADFDRIIEVLHDAINEIDRINNPMEDNDEFFGNYYN